jgi:hypothetical protein
MVFSKHTVNGFGDALNGVDLKRLDISVLCKELLVFFFAKLTDASSTRVCAPTCYLVENKFLAETCHCWRSTPLLRRMVNC